MVLRELGARDGERRRVLEEGAKVLHARLECVAVAPDLDCLRLLQV